MTLPDLWTGTLVLAQLDLIESDPSHRLTYYVALVELRTIEAFDLLDGETPPPEAQAYARALLNSLIAPCSPKEREQASQHAASIVADWRSAQEVQ